LYIPIVYRGLAPPKAKPANGANRNPDLSAATHFTCHLSFWAKSSTSLASYYRSLHNSRASRRRRGVLATTVYRIRKPASATEYGSWTWCVGALGRRPELKSVELRRFVVPRLARLVLRYIDQASRCILLLSCARLREIMWCTCITCSF
jgi:hypothetical protein